MSISHDYAYYYFCNCLCLFAQAMALSSAPPGRFELHTLWIGKLLPEWVPRCIESYLRNGHVVSWWIYYAEERQHDLDAVVPGGFTSHPNLRLRDANLICPREQAQDFYYHGTGPSGKWRGWAPFSDWFRYELLARYGGWWVDVDGVNVRPLQGLCAGARQAVPVFCTERHRRDRRTVGAVAVVDPRKDDFARAGGVPELGDLPPGERQAAFHDWLDSVDRSGLQAGLITNSHFWIPTPRSQLMISLVEQMRSQLVLYAQQVRKHGPSATAKLGSGRAFTGNSGMLLFQQEVRRLLQSARRGTAPTPQVLHWSVFNPIEAVEFDRMRCVLAGEQPLLGSWVRSVHIFRQVRDEWQLRGLAVPTFQVVVSDEPRLPERPAKRATRNPREPGGQQWKRRHTGQPCADVAGGSV